MDEEIHKVRARGYGQGIERALKLKEFASRGNDPENEAAKLVLEKWLESKGMTMEQLSEHEMVYHELSCGEGEEFLLLQCGAHILGKNRSCTKHPKGIRFQATLKEFNQVKDLFEFQVKHYRKELDYFNMAFVHRNTLFAKETKVNDEVKETKLKLTREEQAKVIGHMEAIDRNVFPNSSYKFLPFS